MWFCLMPLCISKSRSLRESEFRVDNSEREKLILKVSYLSILVNCFLSIFKLLCGFFGNSISMISDGIHSLSDVLSTFIVIIGVKISQKVADKEHPYGHERLESAMSIVLAVLLLVVGLGIGERGFVNICNYKTLDIEEPAFINVIAAIISIITKEGMYWITYLVGKKVESSMLKADAWHHRSDALSSIGSLIGVVGAKYFILTDSIASLVICLFILKVAFDIFKDAIDKLVDKACDDKLEQSIIKTMLSIKGVERVDELKTRQFADRIYVDTEIAVDGNLKVSEGHEIAQRVHDKVEQLDYKIKHCAVHVNPI